MQQKGPTVLGIGGTELAIILIFGFLIFGPDRLPAMGRTIGRALRQFRQAERKARLEAEKAAAAEKKPAAAAAKPATTAKKSTSSAAKLYGIDKDRIAAARAAAAAQKAEKEEQADA